MCDKKGIIDLRPYEVRKQEKSDNLIHKVKLAFNIGQRNNQVCRYNTIRKWGKKDG